MYISDCSFCQLYVSGYIVQVPIFYLIMSSNDTTLLNFLFNPHSTKCTYYKLGTHKNILLPVNELDASVNASRSWFCTKIE